MNRGHAATGADSPQLPELTFATKWTFTIAEVSADKAYLGHENLAAIEAVGAVPYVPFKSNSKGEGSAAMLCSECPMRPNAVLPPVAVTRTSP